ncbi:hypothetical protein QVD17_25269 [Tagetes erecta]|uniref:Oleosin n=1 Tax=Tagetes erecta TaxID=13708 RepID=A0AAD8KMG8_TARER|nr:hypothetical protein QVD17_25269 [Tagetes erecta]
MADRYKTTVGQKQPKPTIIINNHARRKQLPSSPESTQLRGLMALLISTGILFILTGATITTVVTSFVLFAPVVIITSPLWLPTSVFMLFVVAMLLLVCGVGLATAVVLVVQLVIKGGD